MCGLIHGDFRALADGENAPGLKPFQNRCVLYSRGVNRAGRRQYGMNFHHKRESALVSKMPIAARGTHKLS